MPGIEPELRHVIYALRGARFPVTTWDEVRRAIEAGDDATMHRLAFEAKVQRRASAKVVRSPLAGKGSPSSLVVIALVSTLILGGAAWSFGGGLLFVPAAIPALTVALVFVTRWASDRRMRLDRAANGGHVVGITMPADVRDRFNALEERARQ